MTWADKSFAFVAQGGYLDKLHMVYPAPTHTSEKLDNQQHKILEDALNQHDDSNLLETMLSYNRFPFRDPYVGFLRQKPDSITSNPITVGRICARIRDMGIDAVVNELESPKEFNRQMGPLFSNWLYGKYPKTSDTNEFRTSKSAIILLNASGSELKRFAATINCGLQKEPDFIAKANGKYVIGESKFIGTEGGHQNRSFDDAMALASSSFQQALAVAVLDGIVWLPNSGQMSRKLSNFGGNVLTALLLDEFFMSI